MYLRKGICLIALILISCQDHEDAIYKIFPLKVNVKNESIDIDCFHGIEIHFEEIEKVELTEEMPEIIVRVGGTSIPEKVKYGNYKIKDLGTVKLFMQSEEPPIVKLHLVGDDYVFINFAKISKTRKVYDFILDRMEKYYSQKSR